MQTRRTRFDIFALSAASLTLLMLAVLAAQSPTQIHSATTPSRARHQHRRAGRWLHGEPAG